VRVYGCLCVSVCPDMEHAFEQANTLTMILTQYYYYTCTFTSTRTLTYTCTHMHIPTHTQIRMHTCAHTHIHTHTRARTYTLIHAHTRGHRYMAPEIFLGVEDYGCKADVYSATITVRMQRSCVVCLYAKLMAILPLCNAHVYPLPLCKAHV